MARLLHGCLFILQIRRSDIGLERLSYQSIKNYIYQHQNITIIIKRESETCPISEIFIIILSTAEAFSFNNLFSRLAALVCVLEVVPFIAFPIFLQQLQEKNSEKILSALSAMQNTKG